MHNIQKKLIKLAQHDDIGQYGYRKLGDIIGVDHPQKVKWHLQKLLRDGYLFKDNDGHIKNVESGSGGLARIPILGQANCGQALSFADNTTYGYITLSPSLIKSRNFDSLFAVRAVGDSMNRCNINGQAINDGDYVIVDHSQNIPVSGDCVVSSVEGLANIKCFYQDLDNKVISLVAVSTRAYPPTVISANDIDFYRIHGKVIQVISNP